MGVPTPTQFEPYQDAVVRAFIKMGFVPNVGDALIVSTLALYTWQHYNENKPDPIERTREHIRKCKYDLALEKRCLEKLERFAPYFFEEIAQ